VILVFALLESLIVLTPVPVLLATENVSVLPTPYFTEVNDPLIEILGLIMRYTELPLLDVEALP
jgi:hypothetical protein